MVRMVRSLADRTFQLRFTELLSESTAAENAAAEAFEKLSRKSKLSKTAKIEEVKGKESETKTLEMNLLNYKEDKETTGKARLGENQDLVFGCAMARC